MEEGTATAPGVAGGDESAKMICRISIECDMYSRADFNIDF